MTRLRRYRWIAPVLVLAFAAGCGSSSGLSLGEERVGSDEADIESRMRVLIEEISRARQADSANGLMPRFNQVKTIACTNARFTVPDLGPRLAHGVFAEPRSYSATLRFANATQTDDREADFRGLSIKLTGVVGARGPAGSQGVQDFLLNSHPALFAGTPADFLAFIEASAQSSLLGFFVRHPRSLWVVLRGRGHPASPLSIPYYSTTPYRHGADAAVKYSVTPCEAPAETQGAGPDADYLRQALMTDLSSGGACLNFNVQFQTDPDLMPMEDASVVWPERASPHELVARIEIPAQNATSPDALAACERMTFNPWNAHPAHRPLGGINRVRRGLYEAMGRFRSAANAQ